MGRDLHLVARAQPSPAMTEARSGRTALGPDAGLRASGSRAERTPLWSGAEVLWVGALTLVVAVAGAWQLSRSGLSNDEAATWAISSHGFGDLVHVLSTSGGDRGATLYYAVAFGWMHVFGTSEVAMRLLSVVAAAATMAPFHAVARRVVDRPAAWASGAILATSSFFLAYARDARTYALAVLLVVLVAWSFLRAVQSGAARDWWIFTGLAIAAVYTHWFSSLVVLALFVALFWTKPAAERARRALVSGVVVSCALAPIVLLVLAGADSGVGWIAPLNADELRALASTLTGSTNSILQLVFLVVLGTGFVAAWRDRRTSETPPILITWFALPVGLTVLIALVKPLLVARYLIIALPGFVLLLGLGLSRMTRGRSVQLCSSVLVLVLIGAHGYRGVWTTTKGDEDWRSIVATVGQHAARDDAIVVFPATAVSAFSYYARDDAGLRGRAGPTWPPVRWDTPFNRTTRDSAVLQAADLTRHPAVWLVVRVPHGGTVDKTVQDSPVLSRLRKHLERRFADAALIPPWSERDTVFVVRYSQPVAP
jgi:Dolichyl-phosphate-mannose-protein mannosyltransferase